MVSAWEYKQLGGAFFDKIQTKFSNIEENPSAMFSDSVKLDIQRSIKGRENLRHSYLEQLTIIQDAIKMALIQNR